jgi:maleylacetoacetate isomerase/maleylpyruvate isomerase
MELYNYYRSSASYRVRIALALKGLDCELLPVHLLRNEQLKAPFSSLSAAGLVPLLKDGDALLTQSLAIIEYLDEVHPEPSLLPGDALTRARIRALALDVACEIHPINNLRVLRYLVGEMKLSEDDKNRWYRHWVETGLSAIEQHLAGDARTGRFCHGDTPTLADCALVPQVHNAQRMACRIDHVPTVMRVFAECMALDAFVRTQPSAYPEAS